MIHLKARSARSTQTGPGSRGGIGHRWGEVDPEAWRERMRAWRASHPEYRERDKLRLHERRRAITLERDRREVDELVARLTPVVIHPSTSRSSRAA
jgi:hypothetical protein